MPGLSLTSEQLNEIVALGQEAAQAAGNHSTAVGIWVPLYDYIASQMEERSIQGFSKDQLYWFREALFINGDQESQPAGFFVRDITRIGMQLSSTTDPQIQDASNQIGLRVYNEIVTKQTIPVFSTQLSLDIAGALSRAGMTVGGWGGSFYFWKEALTLPNTDTETTVEQYILSNPSERTKFINNTARAVVDTYEKFGNALFDDTSTQAAFQKGFSNFLSDLASASVGLDIAEQIASDLGSDAQDTLKKLLPFLGFGFGANGSIFAAVGNATLTGGNGTDIFFGGQTFGQLSNDTFVGGSGSDIFAFVKPDNGSATETIDDLTGKGEIVVLANDQPTYLGGTQAQPLTAIQGMADTWQDADGTRYQFDDISRHLTITQGDLGAGNEIVIDNFDLARAADPTNAAGFDGIHLQQTISLVAAAVGPDPTILVNTQSDVDRVVTVTLSQTNGATIEADIGGVLTPINGDGTFNVTLLAGETSVSFGLFVTNKVPGSGSATMTASIGDAANPSGPPIISAPLTEYYNGGPAVQTPTLTPLAGNYSSGTDTTNYGRGGNDNNDYLVIASGAHNSISLGTGTNSVVGGTGADFIDVGSGPDTIVGGGGQDVILGWDSQLHDGTILRGNYSIYAGTQTDLATAIFQASAPSGSSGRGDLIATNDGNSTIVGGSGDNLIFTGQGSDLIVMGTGNSVFFGGTYILYPVPGLHIPDPATWSVTIYSGDQIGINNLEVFGGDYTATNSEPYNGIYSGGYQVGRGDDVIFAGSGNQYLTLTNGNNYVDAGSGNNTIFGGMGNNTIEGGTGNNFIRAGGGNVYISAVSGNNTIYGGVGSNTILGGTGDDFITSRPFDTISQQLDGSYISLDNFPGQASAINYIEGGAGNDTIFGSAGNDTLIGGDGNDSILAGVGNEYIVGGAGDDSIVGGIGNDTIVAGGSGRDTLEADGIATSTTVIYGGNGTDFIQGGSGTNILYAGDGGFAGAATTVLAGSDPNAFTTIYGGLGTDFLQGGPGHTVIYAGDGGSDSAPTTIVAGNGDTTIYGGLGFSYIQGGSGSNVLYAGDGGSDLHPVTVQAFGGVSTMYGGAGSDVLVAGSDNDVLVGGTGNDTLIGRGNDTLVAGSGDDYFQSDSGTETYLFNPGFGGNDAIQQFSGTLALEFGVGLEPADLIATGALGNDGSPLLEIDSDDGGSLTVVGGLTGMVSSVTFLDPETMSLNQLIARSGVDTTLQYAGSAFVFSVEDHATVTVAGPSQNTDTISAWGNNDILIAGPNKNLIYAEGNNTLVYGGNIADTLVAAGFNDTLVAGSSNAYETFQVDNASTVIQRSSGPHPADTVIASVSYVLPANVQFLTLTGNGNLQATSNNQGGTLTGNAGEDTLIGGSGYDTLIAGSGLDTLIGGSGHELFEINNVGDVIQFGANASNDTVMSSVDYTLPSDVLTLVLSADAIRGTANSQNDTLTANGERDTLIGGSGSNLFIVSDATDVVQVGAMHGIDTIVSSASYTLPTNVNVLTLTRSNVVGTANSQNDILTANASGDTLVGGTGNDILISNSDHGTLISGTGNDTLVANATGTTTFIFNADFGHDEVSNANGSDVIQFGAGITQGVVVPTAVIGADGRPALVLTMGASSVTVDGGMLPGVVNSIAFGGGTALSLAQLLANAGLGAQTLAGANGNFIISTANGVSLTAGGHDTIDAFGNNDTITAGSLGNFIGAFGSGTRLVGGAGNDTLVAAGTAIIVTAGSGNATLIAKGNLDTLVGGSGADTFEIDDPLAVVQNGKTQDVVIASVSYTVPDGVSVMQMVGTQYLSATANSGNDSIVAGNGPEDMFGGTGNDTLVGGTGTDYMYGGSGNTTFVGGTGRAEMFGGAGQNLFIVNNSDDYVVNPDSNYVHETWFQQLDVIQSSVSFTVHTGADLVLTGSADLVGETDKDFIEVTANAGNDTLIATGNSDMLIAGSGLVTMKGAGAGKGTFYVVNNPNDVIIGQAGAFDTVESSASYALPQFVDILSLDGTNDLVATANNENDSINGNGGNDTLIAGAGNDTLSSQYGSSGHNTFIAGSGNDIMWGNSGDTFVFNQGFGSSTVYMQNGDLGPNAGTGGGPTAIETIQFGPGIALSDLTLSATIDNGGEVALVIKDGASSSVALSGTLESSQYNVPTQGQVHFTNGTTFSLDQLLHLVPIASTTVIGADGNLIFNGATAASLVGGAGNDTIYGLGANDTIVAGSGADILVAEGSAVSVVGGAGADTLYGFGTNDTLVAGSAITTLVGGTGASVMFVVNNASDVIQVQANPGNDTVSSSATFKLPTNINTLLLTGSASVKGTANNGNDTLISNTGIDTLVGGTGNDLFIVNNASDVVTVGATHGNDTIQSSVSFTLASNVANLVLTGAGNLTGTGNNLAHTLTANSGNDTLNAGTGIATLIGGTGDDLFVVNNSSDVVQVGSTHGNDTIKSSVSYVLPANVANLTLTGTTNLTGTGNGLANVITANSGADTLIAGTGIATLIGGTGNDTFVINNASDVVQVGSTHGTDLIQSSVSYVLPANVAKLTLIGSANLSATGNTLANTLTANSGADTLIAGTGIATLVGGTGNDLFIVNNTSDVVTVGATHGNDTIQSSVSYTASANVANLTLIGTSNLTATGNTMANVLTANSGNDTLTAGTGLATMVGGAGNDLFIVNNATDVVQDAFTTTSNTIQSSVTYTLPTNVNALIFTGTGALKGTANNGNDTLTSNTGIDTLVAGTGNDLFIVNNVSDVITVGATHGSDSIQSSVSFTLPTNVQYLALTGSGSLTATGNSLTDLIIGNTGNDTLTGGTGIAVLEAGTAGHDLLQASGSQAAFIGGGASDTLTGGAKKDFYAAGLGGDTITTGATANVVSINKGDGADVLQPTSGASNVLSLGHGIDTENLTFTKTGNNLILSDGVAGDSITFTNWYASSANQNYVTLQVVEIASANYNSGSSDHLRNQALEEFNFTSLVSQFNTAGSPASWLLKNGMPTAQLADSATAAYGGDLAYYFGLNGNLTGLNLTTAQSTLTNASFATATQTIDPWAGISGGPIHLS